MAFSPAVGLLLGASLVSLFVAGYVLPRRQVPGALALGLIGLSIAVWSLGYALEIGLPTPADKFFWGQVQYIGIAFAPFAWLVFSVAYTSTRRGWGNWVHWLGAIPALTVVLALTTQHHQLVWQRTFTKQAGNFSVLGVEYGPWFWVHFGVSYLFLLAGTIILLRSLGRMQGLYRAQIAALVLAVASPWVGNILYFSGLTALDFTPFAFAITVLALVWAIFGYRLTDIAPIARDLVVEALREGLIVLDMNGRVADMNASAGRMIGVPAGQSIGRDIVDLLRPWPHLIERFRHVLDATETISVGSGETRHSYEVRISALLDRQQRPVGRVINLREAGDAPVVSPTFAYREPVTTQRVDVDSAPTAGEASGENSLWRAILGFYAGQGKARVDVAPGANPSWARTIERAATIILRVIATLGTLALVVFAYPYPFPPSLFNLIICAIIVMIWVLALARHWPFGLRVWFFSALTYALALNELLNYGYSAEAFTFFMTFISLAALLGGTRGGLWAMAAGLITLGGVGGLIGAGIMRPFSVAPDSDIFPTTIGSAIISLIAFSASSAGVVAAIVALLHSLNSAWQQETQALALLQQERDLLEKRVAERTAALAEARDLAVQNSAELRKYFLALEQSGNSIVITDLQGRIEYVNPFFERITGYAIDEVLGKNPRVLQSGEQPSGFYREMWNAISNGKVWQGQFLNKRKNGSLYWENATIAPVQNERGEITHYVGIKEDISAAKELQENLRRQNEYLAILHQTTLDLLNRQNLPDLLTAVVERACQILDAPLGEIMLKEGEYMVVRAFTKNQPYLLGDKVARGEAKLTWQAHDTGQPVILDDYTAWSEHRDIYASNPLHAIADFPVMVGDTCIAVLALGRTRENYPFTPDQVETGILFARLVALVLDNAHLYNSALDEIEQRKQAEAQLEVARDQALEASRFKSQLLAKVSHELRTPLGGVIGYAGLLAQDAFGELTADQKDAVANIEDSANYLLALINDLLDQAQMESRSLKINLAPFSPQDLLARVRTTLEVQGRKKSLEMEFTLAPGVPSELSGDVQRLQQILINLTGNAIKFTMVGHVRVDIFSPDPAHWAMRVSDTGAGIPPESQKMVFEPFRQLDNSITRNNRGTGLGLSITQQLVETMGGVIHLESEIGKGSTFTVIFPLENTDTPL